MRIRKYTPRSLNVFANESGAGNPTIVFLPVVPETEAIVKSFISSIVSDDIVFKLYEANKYAENGFDIDPDRIKPNANDIVEKLMKFEAQIFDAQVFNVKDNRLFSYRPTSVIVPPSFFVKLKDNFPGIAELDECVWWMETVSSDDGETWEDTGYEWSEGDCEDGDFWEGGTGPDIGAGGGGGSSGPGGTGGTPENDCPGWYKLMPNYEGGGFDPGTPYPCDNPPAPYLDDPCMQSQVAANTATTLSQNQHFISAKSDVIQSGADGNEHAVSFGKDASGNIIRTAVNSGGVSSGTVPTIDNRFADLHNHPNSLPPSPGDFYTFSNLATSNSNYQRFVVLADGTVYALALTNQAKLSTFLTQHPPINLGFGPDFPDDIFNKFQEVKDAFMQQSYEPLIAEEAAMAFILDNFNSGVVLLKQNSSGQFKRLQTKEKNTNGTITYTINNCP